MKKYNIEVWRFLFTISVALLHFGWYNGLYIAVDFFLMLSGYFIAAETACNMDGTSIFLRKFKRLAPHYYLSFFLMMGYMLFTGWERTALVYATDTLLQAACLYILFPASNTINGITWYLSAMLVCLPLIIYLAKHARHLYASLIAPLAAIGIYSFFVSHWGHVDFGLVWLGGANGGLLRAFGGLSAGFFLHEIRPRLSDVWKRAGFDLSFLEITIGGFVIVFSAFNRQTKFDAVNVILLAVLILVAMEEDGFFSRLSNNAVVGYLGRLSYAIYLDQLFVGGAIHNLLAYKVNRIILYVLYIVALIIFSAFTDFLVRKIDKKISSSGQIKLVLLLLIIFEIASAIMTPISASQDLHCSIDSCNGVSILTSGEYTITTEDSALRLEGWAEKISEEVPVDRVTVLCNGNVYEAQMRVERADVANTLDNDALLYSGWVVEIPADDARADKDQELQVTAEKEKEYKTFTITVKNEESGA